MFTLKTEAYLYLIHFLWASDYKKDEIVDKIIQKLQLVVENHEQDVLKVLSYLDELLDSPAFETNYSESFRIGLIFLKKTIEDVDFSKAPVQERFENPLRRLLDSLMAINLLTKPTTPMMHSVKQISDGIIGILEQYEELSEEQQEYINTFLFSLENLKGPNNYQAAISLGSFLKKPSILEVIELLRANESNKLSEIMHIHFKFALLASRNVPLSTTPIREPVGKFKDIIEQKESGGYTTYFEKLARSNVDSDYNGYLANQVIFKSELYTIERNKGRLGELDYSNKTQKLGLMRDNHSLYESIFLTMPLPWVADAKAMSPNLSSRVTLDMVENDTIYVGGPSGMTSLLLHLMENLGNFSSIQEKQSYLAAICGYIVGGGFHSFHEVLAPAAYCLDLIPGYEVTVPDIRTHKKGAAPAFGAFFDALSNFDEEFKSLREMTWEQNLSCISKVHSQFLDYTQNIQKHIEDLKNENKDNLPDNNKIIFECVRYLEEKTEQFSCLPIEEKINTLEKFQDDCVTKINEVHTQLRSNTFFVTGKQDPTTEINELEQKIIKPFSDK